MTYIVCILFLALTGSALTAQKPQNKSPYISTIENINLMKAQAAAQQAAAAQEAAAQAAALAPAAGTPAKKPGQPEIPTIMIDDPAEISSRQLLRQQISASQQINAAYAVILFNPPWSAAYKEATKLLSTPNTQFPLDQYSSPALKKLADNRLLTPSELKAIRMRLDADISKRLAAPAQKGMNPTRKKILEQMLTNTNLMSTLFNLNKKQVEQVQTMIRTLIKEAA